MIKMMQRVNQGYVITPFLFIALFITSTSTWDLGFHLRSISENAIRAWTQRVLSQSLQTCALKVSVT